MRLGRALLATAGVHGTVRSARDGAPLAEVQIAIDGVASTSTDSLGHYAIDGLAPGAHEIDFVAFGFASRRVGVMLIDSRDLALDVTLASSIVVLPNIDVAVTALPSGSVARAAADASSDLLEPGRFRLETGWQNGAVAEGVDPYRQLLGASAVATRGGSATALDIRGGAGDENLVLLDGFPVFDATHFAGSASAIDPDAVGSVTLHTGVSSARFGGRLSGVLELQTADSAIRTGGSTGAVGLSDVRSLVRSPIGNGGGFLVGMRASYRDLLTDGDGTTTPNAYRDVIGAARLPLRGGTLQFTSFASANQLDLETPDGDGATARAISTAAAAPVAPALAWHTATVGAAWHLGDPARRQVAVGGWWAGAVADIGWPDSSTDLQMHSAISDIGIAGEIETPAAAFGVSVDRPATIYSVAKAAVGPVDTGTTFHLGSAPVIASAWGEVVRRIGPFTARAGLRANSDFATNASLDPRVSLAVPTSATTRFDVAAGRTHQTLQPMLNDENLLGNVVGIELPVAAGHGLPTARADQVALDVTRTVSPSLEIDATVYLRRWNGVVLPAASTTGLFVSDSVAVGSGQARGFAADAAVARGRWGLRGSFALASTTRTVGAQAYAAGFDRPWSARADITFHVATATIAELVFSANAGNPATAVASAIDWRPAQLATGGGDLGGTPVGAAGPINSMQLPGSSSLDLGLRRSWPVALIGRRGAINATVRVANLLNQRDAVGLADLASGGVRLLRGNPRGATVELGWVF